ncbi:MAG: putative glycoside hydrolase, partial [Terriglobales bacterium]
MSRSVGPVVIAVASLVLLAAMIFSASAWTPTSAHHQPKTSFAAASAVTTPAPSAVSAPMAPPGTVLHVVAKGENVPVVIRKYWVASSFMTHGEMEAALRQRNTGIKGIALKPGETLVIPGMEGPITQQPVPVPTNYEVRAIYLTGVMAGSVNGMNLIQRWRAAGGNAVVFDVKDSDGIVNIPFQHPLNTGGPHPYIPNLPKFTRWLHEQGMHAIVRIAIFRDEKLVTTHPELAVQSRSRHQAWRENGKLVWTDPSKPEVQQFNIALARQAALDGVDEVQFDYVR